MNKFIKKNLSFKRLVINFIRFLLFVIVIVSYASNRPLIMIMALLGFFFTYIPLILYKLFKIRVPAEFEIIVLMFLFGLQLFLGKRGFDELFWWWDILVTLLSSLILGFIGLTIFYVLEREDVIEASSIIIIFFTFCFAFSIGATWEIFEFIIDYLFGFGLQESLVETMFNLMINFIAAILVSFFGYYNLKYGKHNFVSHFFTNVIRKNKNLFYSKKHFERSSNIVPKIIDKGEGEFIEFKSTIRKNLHTKKIDKNVEHSFLKTIVGYLNTKGGTLLVGVKDDGDVIGIDFDEFESHDKMRLYVTNLIRKNLGNQFLSSINFDLYPYKNKFVLMARCKKSLKPVFLNWENNEEFYVRHSASTIKLSGNDLINYVKENF